VSGSTSAKAHIAIVAVVVIACFGFLAWYVVPHHHGSSGTSTGVGSSPPVDADQLLSRFEALKKSAEAGDAQAQYDVAQCYATGSGTPKNEATAIIWFEKSALAKNPLAELEMGHRFYDGKGVPQNIQRGAANFELAANAGNAEAQFWTGHCYDVNQGALGRGSAFPWYLKSAQQGFGLAQYALSFNGEGMLTEDQCVAWCRKAADGGIAVAQVRMGNRCADGDGVPQDFFESAKWFKLAADQNDCDGFFGLGVLYKKGLGVQQSRDTSVAMFKKAIDLGYKSNMTAEQMADDQPKQQVIVNGQLITLPAK